MKWLTECWSFQAMIISSQAPAKKFVVLVDPAAQSLRNRARAELVVRAKSLRRARMRSWRLSLSSLLHSKFHFIDDLYVAAHHSCGITKGRAQSSAPGLI
jgi:hypothetical protein